MGSASQECCYQFFPFLIFIMLFYWHVSLLAALAFIVTVHAVGDQCASGESIFQAEGDSF